MKKIILIIIASILSFLVLSSCDRVPEKTVSATNQDYKVELLFSVDSIKVYRFKDAGDYVYFTSNPGNHITNQGYTTRSGYREENYIE